jgi:hypothetical protein
MTLSKTLFGMAIAAGVLALSSPGASAAIVCNAGNVCWHAHLRYGYPSGAHMTIHDDAWKAGPTIKFREHEGRGYWDGDRWTEW